MKNIVILILCIMTISIWSCKTDNPDFGEPFSKIEGIADDWELVQLKVTDMVTKNSNNSVDVSAFSIGGTPATLTFSTDFTFTGNAGTSKMYIPINGSWAFDNNDYPTQLILTANATSYTLDLLAPVRERVDQYLHFNFVKPYTLECVPADAETSGNIAYEYKFIRR